MSIATGEITIKCNNCDITTNLTSDDADFEITSVEDKPMGPETCHAWETSFECNSCKKTIELIYEVWEYPTGAYDNEEINSDGGEASGTFYFDFIGEPNPED